MTVTDVGLLRSRLRLAFDTNILVYAERVGTGPSDQAKATLVRRILDVAADDDIVLPRQALAELQRVLVRKAGLSAAAATDRVRLWAARGDLIDTDAAVFEAALDLAADHGLQIFDAIILAAAADARCDLLLSEDLQNGFSWRGVTVANPFAAALDQRLMRILTG